MGEEITIGEGVLDYIEELGMILDGMEEIYAYAVACCRNITEAEAYEGEAVRELTFFFVSLAQHLQKMVLLYQASVSYITNAYMTLYYNEQQLIDHVISLIGE